MISICTVHLIPYAIPLSVNDVMYDVTTFIPIKLNCLWINAIIDKIVHTILTDFNYATLTSLYYLQMTVDC